MPLTDAAIRNAKLQEKPYKLFDGGGLFVLATPAGGKWWRLKYRFGGKEKQLSLGKYPLVTLDEARARRDEAKRLLANGIDPSDARKDMKSRRQFSAEINFMRDKIAEIAALAVKNKLSLEVSVGVRVPATGEAAEIQPIGTFVINCPGKG